MDDHEEDLGTLLADGFEDALLGLGDQYVRVVAVYDYDKCVEILMTRDGMTYEDAEEFMSFNVTGAGMGDFTPVFLHRKPVDEDGASE